MRKIKSVIDLSTCPTDIILAELEKRNRSKKTEKTNNIDLVFGTIGIDGGTNFVEVFKKIKTEKDLDFLIFLSLRSRFNSHRQYKGFYFKTSDFNKLKKESNENNILFANWIRGNNNIKYISL